MIQDKKISKIFNNIAKKYDVINSILSLGLDKSWRYKTVNILFNKIIENKYNNYIKVLDIATGTGDLAILLANNYDKINIIGMDISENMISMAIKKITCNIKKKINFLIGSIYKTSFCNEKFDIITIAFGIRNFLNIHSAMLEIYRILKQCGILVILEFSQPKNYFIKTMYDFYNTFFTKIIGGILSKNYNAYKYLEQSIKSFKYCGNNMKKLLEKYNFYNVKIYQISYGIVSIYYSVKS